MSDRDAGRVRTPLRRRREGRSVTGLTVDGLGTSPRSGRRRLDRGPIPGHTVRPWTRLS